MVDMTDMVSMTNHVILFATVGQPWLKGGEYHAEEDFGAEGPTELR